MNAVSEWICDLLMSRGALVEPGDSGRIGAMLPSELAALLGVDEWFSLDLRDDSADWLDRMERVLPAQPLLVEAQYLSAGPPRPIDAASILNSELAIQNGIWRLVEDSAATAAYLFFTFQYAIESDDRSLGIATVCINASAGSLVTAPENFFLGIRDGLVETSGVTEPDMVKRSYPPAVRAAQAGLRGHVAQAEENANRRLARDTARVESYYAGLLAQIEKRIAKRANDAAGAEKERGRQAATQADRAAKLEDLRRKYALGVRMEPALLLAVRAPVRRISVRLIRKKEERAHALDWNPILGVLESPLCEHCGARAYPLHLCERVHLLCKDCWAPCPACSRLFCRVCQPHCKCGAAKPS